MKTMFFMCLLSIACQSMALTTIYDGAKSVSSHQYLRLNFKQKQAKERFGDNQSAMSGLPAKSQLQAGEFDSYQLSECQKYPTPFFVIGADELSIAWLDAHSQHLKDVHAFGLITNIDTEKELKEIEIFSPVNLIPSNVDGLAQVVKAPFYPFFTNGCEVWQ